MTPSCAPFAETQVIFPTSLPFPSPSFAQWREVAEGARGYLASPEAPMLLNAWMAAGSGERPPSRQSLAPESMPRILSDIWLMDYVREKARLRYRLVGENVRARYDFPLAGKYLDDTLADEARETVLSYFRACVERPAICLVVGRLYHEWQRPSYGERLLLPLLDEDGAPEGLVGVTICKQTFPSRPVAEERAKRITCILPLDGSASTEKEGVVPILFWN